MVELEMLQSLLRNKRVIDLYALVRYMYRIGHPIVEDQFYEKLDAYCKQHAAAFPGLQDYVDRTYDDDPIPYSLLQEFGLDSYVYENSDERAEYFQYLDEDKSLSIEAVTEYQDAYAYFSRVYGQRLVMSLKVDGINNKSSLNKVTPEISELKLTLSRGRNGRGMDFTPQILNVVPRFYNDLPDNVRVTAEAYVETEALEYLRNKYDPSGYKMEKSAAISMLRVKHDAEDYKHLKVLAHGADGLDTTLSGTYRRLKEIGFDVVPHIVIEPDEVPLSYDDFVPWLQDKFDIMLELSKDIPSDGVVVDVDDYNYVSKVTNQYSNRNIALKMEYWSFDNYFAVVKGIISDQQRVECSVRLDLEPVLAKDRSTATKLNGYNVDIVIEEGLLPGNMVCFARDSGAINKLVRGRKLSSMNIVNN